MLAFWRWLFLVPLLHLVKTAVPSAHRPLLRKRLVPQTASIDHADLLKPELAGNPLADTSSRASESPSLIGNTAPAILEGDRSSLPAQRTPKPLPKESWPPAPPQLESEKPNPSPPSEPSESYQIALNFWRGLMAPPSSAVIHPDSATSPTRKAVPKTVKEFERLRYPAPPPPKVEGIRVKHKTPKLTSSEQNHGQTPDGASPDEHPNSSPTPPDVNVADHRKHREVQTIERPLRLSSHQISPSNTPYYLARLFRQSDRVSPSPPSSPPSSRLPALPANANTPGSARLPKNILQLRPSLTSGMMSPRLGRKLLSDRVPSRKEFSSSLPEPRVQDNLFIEPRRSFRVDTGDKVGTLPAYTTEMSRFIVDLPSLADKVTVSGRHPLPPQPARTRLLVTLISRVYGTKPLVVDLAVAVQHASPKQAQSTIHIYLPPEFHAQLTACFQALTKLRNHSQKSFQRIRQDTTPVLTFPSTTATSNPSFERIWPLSNGPSPSLERPNRLLLSSVIPDHEVSGLKAQHGVSGLKDQRGVSELIDEDPVEAKGPLDKMRSLFEMTGVKALVETLSTISPTQVLRKLFDRGAKAYSELPPSRPFVEAKKLSIMSAIKSGSASGQETVGQLMSRLRSLLTSAPRHDQAVVGPRPNQLRADSSAFSANIRGIGGLFWSSYHEIPTRDVLQEKPSLAGSRLRGEKPKIPVEYIIPAKVRASVKKPESDQDSVSLNRRRMFIYNIILDPETLSTILKSHSLLFKSSSRSRKGAEIRRTDPLVQLTLPTRPPSSESQHRAIVLKNQQVAPTSQPGSVFPLISGKAFFAPLHTIVSDYQHFLKSLLRHSTGLYSVKTSSERPGATLRLGEAASGPSRLNLARPYESAAPPKAIDTSPSQRFHTADPIPKPLDLITPQSPETVSQLHDLAKQGLGSSQRALNGASLPKIQDADRVPAGPIPLPVPPRTLVASTHKEASDKHSEIHELQPTDLDSDVDQSHPSPQTHHNGDGLKEENSLAGEGKGTHPHPNEGHTDLDDDLSLHFDDDDWKKDFPPPEKHKEDEDEAARRNRNKHAAILNWFVRLKDQLSKSFSAIKRM
ncbi:hypothetical protein PCANC_26974 [Puccinia coronata f. sp. avenae]|uniref:Uncharacterized protein n=1 Tax=Puccinia coronata f. sp. avenae TaxID=200324 RepID=A0A2N5RY34_9BASI|nr:hypothetical protein PCANC_26974 [Puccinia coronata f. sp. avenae]